MKHASGTKTVQVNQRTEPKEGAFETIGWFDFSAGKSWVEIANTDTDGHVIADTVQLLPVDDE